MALQAEAKLLVILECPEVVEFHGAFHANDGRKLFKSVVWLQSRGERFEWFEFVDTATKYIKGDFRPVPVLCYLQTRYQAHGYNEGKISCLSRPEEEVIVSLGNKWLEREFLKTLEED